MTDELSFEPLDYLELSDDQYSKIGKIIHRASELDAIITMLGIHLRMMKSKDDSKYYRLYEKHFGASGSVNFVRDKLHDLPDSEARTISLIMDICLELLEHRNAIAHGFPRKNSSGIPFMWRQLDDKTLPSERRHLALQIDNDSLEKILADLYAAHERVRALLHYYWPPFRGENPHPVAATRIEGSKIGREEILYTEKMERALASSNSPSYDTQGDSTADGVV